MFFKKDKFIPYGKHKITLSDLYAVLKVLKGNLITQGPKVSEFEKLISSIVGSKYSVAVNSATSALHIACLALGLKKGDILWTSPITFVASANVGKLCGAEVDFVDIDAKTGLMSIDFLKEKLKKASNQNKLPKIVMPVHLAGTSCDMEEIYNLSKEYGFKIIEDASHAIGGVYKNNRVGSCAFSDITVFSFHPVKIITTGEGGLASTNNKSLEKNMRMIANHGITKAKEEFIGQYKDSWIYEQQLLGYNYRITDIQCALGISQISRLESVIKKRNKRFLIYKDLLKNLPIYLLEIPKNVRSSHHLAIIKLEDSNPTKHRRIFNYLRENKIGVQLHYFPVHLQPFYKSLGFTEGYLPISEEYSKSVMSIPLYPELKIFDQKRIVNRISYIIKKL